MDVLVINPADRVTVSPLDGVIAGWLDEKSKITNSQRTPAIYRAALESFRSALAAVGIDLDAPAGNIFPAAQAWAGQRSLDSKRPGPVSPSTIKQRLAILSSFYEYAIRAGLATTNPIDRVKRPKAQQYANATALDSQAVEKAMQRIDRHDIKGKRDYALLAVALTTGRRVSAVAGLRWRDVHMQGDSVVLTFNEKGGKVMRDELAGRVGRSLMSWLHAYYGAGLGDLAPDAPIWVSLDNRTRGTAMGIQSIADVAEKRLGTSKFHALRHTFARRMDKRGARLTEIQARLGHNDPKTTGIYLAQLNSAENAYVDGIADDFGLTD